MNVFFVSSNEWLYPTSSGILANVRKQPFMRPVAAMRPSSFFSTVLNLATC